MTIVGIVLVYTIYTSLVLIVSAHDQLVLRIASIAAFVGGLYLLLKRDTYLPFLGPAAVPPSLLKDVSAPDGSNVQTTVRVNAVNGSKVLYWGAMPGDPPSSVIATPQLAYKDFTNAGVCVVSKGTATFKFFCPVRYKVPWGKTLDRHIHYRVVHNNGMLGSVQTVYVNC
jgi:hypothetical protein